MGGSGLRIVDGGNSGGQPEVLVVTAVVGATPDAGAGAPPRSCALSGSAGGYVRNHAEVVRQRLPFVEVADHGHGFDGHIRRQRDVDSKLACSGVQETRASVFPRLSSAAPRLTSLVVGRGVDGGPLHVLNIPKRYQREVGGDRLNTSVSWSCREEPPVPDVEPVLGAVYEQRAFPRLELLALVETFNDGPSQLADLYIRP